MCKLLSNIAVMGIFLLSLVSNALTLNGTPRQSPLSICFDESTIVSFIGQSNFDERKVWVRDAIQKDGWGYYSQMNFSGWNSCAANPQADIWITMDANGSTMSGGNKIWLPFAADILNPNFIRFTLHNTAIHEMGHQLGYPHETTRTDAPEFYQENSSQKFELMPSTIAGGWFQIVRSYNHLEPFSNRLCVEVSNSPAITVTQQLCNGGANQRFKFLEPNHTWSRLQNQANGRCLDIQSSSLNNGANVVHWPCYNSDTQRFRKKTYSYNNVGSNPFVGFQNKNSGKYIDNWNGVNGGAGAFNPGVHIIQWEGYARLYDESTTPYDPESVLNPTSPRRHGFIFNDLDIFAVKVAYGDSGKPKLSNYLVAKHSNMCWSFSEGSSSQAVCDESASDQKFRVIYLDADEFRISDVETNQCVTVVGGSLTLEDCKLEKDAGDDRQRFTLIQGEGSLWSEIKSIGSGLCLDVVLGSQSPGTNIVLYSCHGGNNQKFSITTEDELFNIPQPYGLSCNQIAPGAYKASWSGSAAKFVVRSNHPENEITTTSSSTVFSGVTCKWVKACNIYGRCSSRSYF